MLFIYDIGKNVDSNKHDVNGNNEVGADNLMGAYSYTCSGATIVCFLY